jgi:hypothetical protein
MSLTSRILLLDVTENGPCGLIAESGMYALGRLCCKSRKSQGREFFAKPPNGKHSLVSVVWSVIAVACFLPSFLIAWQSVRAAKTALIRT